MAGLGNRNRRTTFKGEWKGNLKLIVDTREQKPLHFTHSFITEIKRKKLDVGDYAVEFEDGFVPKIAYERKSIEDLFGTLGKGYGRFKREIERALDNKVRLSIIVEKPLVCVSRGIDRSVRSGDAVISQLFTIRERYGIEPVFCNGREECSAYITQSFLAVGREYIKGKCGKTTTAQNN